MRDIQSILCRTSIAALVAVGLAGSLAADEHAAIFVMRLDGTDVRRVADVQGRGVHAAPRWSHDGKQLVFGAIAEEGKNARWYVAGFDGSGAREMGRGAWPDWSPDDKQLAFAVGAGTAIQQGIWVQNADGQGRARLTAGDYARWSPGGNALAILDGTSLALFDLIDLKPQKLSTPSGVLAGFDWSPDGGRLAFVTGGEGERALWVVDMPAADAPQKRLSGELDGTVAWSSDGKRLAIALAGKIHSIAADGGDAAQPIAGQEGVNRMPAWSPDARWLAFVSTRTTPALAKVAPTRRTVRLDEVKRLDRGNMVFSLAVTPDGRQALLPGRRDLVLYNFAEDTDTRLPFKGAVVALAPDGQTLAVCGTTVKIDLGNLEGKSIRTLPSGSMGIGLDFSPDGSLLAFAQIGNNAMVWDVLHFLRKMPVTGIP